MMWIKITAPFEWRPNKQQIYVFKVGEKYSVTRKCGQEAIEQGCAVKLATPTRDEAKCLSKLP